MQYDAHTDDEQFTRGSRHAGAAGSAYAVELLRALGRAPARAPDLRSTHPDALARAVADDWAACGLMPLCGDAAGPPRRARHGIPSCARGALLALRVLAGHDLLAGVDGATLLSERAALHGRSRAGRVSVNGQCHLLPTRDGWLALNLAREDDLELLPAWLTGDDGDTLAAHDLVAVAAGELAPLRAAVATRSTAALVDRGALLGLPLAAPAEHPSPSRWFMHHAATSTTPPSRMPRVLDLSALWAGPLATHLLHAAGAAVTRLESRARPDASRDALPAFHALLNACKRQCTVDLDTAAGLRELRAHIDAADIVLESARPRALQQLGIDAVDYLRRSPGKVWLRIAGHDPAAPEGMHEGPGDDLPRVAFGDDLPRVAFGDDAAIAGGAALEDANGPHFCGDALADPLTGLHAAVAALAHWQDGRGGLLTLSLAGVTGWCVARTQHVPVREPAPPTVRMPQLRRG